MKVCVIGSHGTGKSTLCKQLSQKLGMNYIPDVVPQAFEKKFEINESTPTETQLWILSKQIELERNTETPWVSEKSLWDNIIYGQFSLEDKMAVEVIERVAIANAKYDHVFYLPIEFPIVDDGLRSTNVHFQKRIDEMYVEFLKSNGFKFTVLSGPPNRRLEKALGIIAPVGKSRI